VVEAPAIRTRPLDAALPDLAAFDLVCVTSPNGAHALFARLDAAGLDARALAGRAVAAIGPGTARALAEHGIRADVVPERAVAEGLADALAGADVRRALVVRGREGRDVLPDALRARGAEVELLLLYETVAEPLDAETAAAAGAADYVTFTSASTVRFFLRAAGGLDGPRIASIGPATSAALREAGLEPAVEADPHTPDGLVAALLADAATLE
jgi:uroporphyrinogen III methyltransferase/synthase